MFLWEPLVWTWYLISLEKANELSNSHPCFPSGRSLQSCPWGLRLTQHWWWSKQWVACLEGLSQLSEGSRFFLFVFFWCSDDQRFHSSKIQILRSMPAAQHVYYLKKCGMKLHYVQGNSLIPKITFKLTQLKYVQRNLWRLHRTCSFNSKKKL